MEPGVNQQPSAQIPNSSTFNSFTGRSFQAGYMGPELGRAPQELLQDQQIHNHPNPSSHSRFHLAPQPFEMHAAILREIERERIRDEIILEDIARRRVLEAEVLRRQLMREAALQRGSIGTFPFDSSQLMESESLRLSLLGTRAEGRSLDVSLPHAERLNGSREVGGLEVSCQRCTNADLRVVEGGGLEAPFRRGTNADLRVIEGGRLQTPIQRGAPFQRGNNADLGVIEGGGLEAPFQRGTNADLGVIEGGGLEAPFQRSSNADLKVVEVKSIQEESKKKESIITMAKPKANRCGLKRKSVTPPRADDADEMNKKKSKEDWSCALCQLIATGEKAWSEHLQGKKHKAKEAALRARRAGKNYSIGLFPKKNKETMEVVEIKDPGTEVVVEEATEKRDDLPPIGGNTNLGEQKIKSEVLQESEKNGGKSKDKKFKFWCDMCKVGAHCKNIMIAHEKGKKHVKRLRKIEENV